MVITIEYFAFVAVCIFLLCDHDGRDGAANTKHTINFFGFSLVSPKLQNNTHQKDILEMLSPYTRSACMHSETYSHPQRN